MMVTKSIGAPQFGETSSQRRPGIRHRGRVRTGCLICRARKVKCDEQRPNCQNCNKAKRKCAYKRVPPLMPIQPAPAKVDQPQHQNLLPREPFVSQRQTPPGDGFINGQLLSPVSTFNPSGHANMNIPEDTVQQPQGLPSAVEVGVSSCNNPEVSSFHRDAGADSPSARFYTTSLQIYVTTALDFLCPPGITGQSYSYFIEEVDCPTLSAFDYLNWKRMKLHAVQLAIQDESIAAAILAVQSVYRAQVNRLPMFSSTSEYQARLASFELMVADDAIDFANILITSLLLCLCEVILPNEDSPALRVFGPEFEVRLTAWLLSTDRSPISLRICAWLQLLHVATKRSGCCGLLPESVFDILSNHIPDVSKLPPAGNHSDSTSAMYDIISAPIFAFHLELQRISNQIQDLSHYRRSRITPADQAEVTEIVTSLNGALSTLWNGRPSPLQFQPSQLRENFCPMIAEPLVALVGVCSAAYFGEVLGLRRTLGDDPFPSPESQQPMSRIRDIIEGDWNASSEGALNPGYVRPLFLYAIENLQQEETEWAVARLRQIKSPISRSEFIATLGKAMGQEQRMEKRRVATKYFCNGAFNVMVPAM